MVRFAGRCCAVMREVGVRCEPHVRTVRKSRGEPVRLQRQSSARRSLLGTRSVQNGFFFFFFRCPPVHSVHCTVSIVLNTCRSAGWASNRSTDRQIRVVPEQIADQQIGVPSSNPFFEMVPKTCQGSFFVPALE